MAGVSVFGAGFFVFSCALDKTTSAFLSERRKGQWDAQREPNRVRVFTGRVPSWHELKLVAETSEKQRRMLAVHKMSEPAVGIIRDSYRESNLSPGAAACFAADDT